MDLVVVCTDKPYNGTWFFENSGQTDPQTKLPILKPAVLVGKSAPSVGISYVTGKPVVTATASVKRGDIYDFRGNAFPDFTKSQFSKPTKIGVPEKIFTEPGNIRQNQWQLVDFDGDGALDVSLGIDFWGDFGPLNGGEGAFNAQGEWTAANSAATFISSATLALPPNRPMPRPCAFRLGAKTSIPSACRRRAGATSTATVTST